MKKDGVTTKEVPLIGACFHSLIDHLFWYLPFLSVKEGNALIQELENVTEDDWNTTREELKDELKLPSARDNLINGWKAWIAENGSSKSGATPSNKRLKSQVRNE